MVQLPQVAREAIRAVFERREPARAAPCGRRAPVFVTLRIDGKLRGCMGTLVAQHDDVVDETADRARVAAFEDPRFPPLEPAELDRCTIEVTILGELEAASEADLDAAVYGVDVTDDHGRRAVLLPAIDGIDTVQTQLRLVRRKAGIPEGEPISIRRFAVETESDE
ncbi:MAG: AmmeMemoRadiSam system protein A [Planctomycetota bacterium]